MLGQFLSPKLCKNRPVASTMVSASFQPGLTFLPGAQAAGGPAPLTEPEKPGTPGPAQLPGSHSDTCEDQRQQQGLEWARLMLAGSGAQLGERPLGPWEAQFTLPCLSGLNERSEVKRSSLRAD